VSAAATDREVGKQIKLTASATDDGIPARPWRTRGLSIKWIQYRGLA